MSDLFEHTGRREMLEQKAPLATRMRPRSLSEFIGQQHIAGPGTLLRSAIEQGRIPSMIFYGPPGCGKTTLASVIEQSTGAAFETFNAVTSGLPDLRKVVARAAEEMALSGRQTILFVDEIHRFNRTQQDGFLPHVEQGLIVLIGATTENPYFEVNSPLLSRCRIYQFEPLTQDDVRELVMRALTDVERGLGALSVTIEEDALAHLLDVAGGDARAALNALEMAAPRAVDDKENERVITARLVEDALRQRILDYDKAGDARYDTVSAFIKSMRGSDPDAALYWLAKMITAGEDPKYIARRMVILAAEDVGNADPMALVVATSAAQAVDYVGLPEAQIPLAQAVIYLACAHKSNASYKAIGAAMDDVRNRPPAEVPPHLKSSGYRGAQSLGRGIGYVYPHDHPGHIAEQDYLPPGAKSSQYYTPTQNGYEKKIAERLAAWRQELNARSRRSGSKGSKSVPAKPEDAG
ncbi:MAG: replication-associated recombination protein A [Armatimonadetes bacterium]|nr:replication-associated recombination protein A [Armatimonadota bacterium]